MKTLTLLRHAKSSWDDPAATDFDRPLNKRGRQGAQAIGAEMHQLGFAFDAVLASPATRVVETLAEAAKGYGAPFQPAFDERIYLASPATLLALVRDADESADRLLLVGHNPGLERLAMLLARDNALRAELAVKYPTGTLAELTFDTGSWRDIAEGAGTLTRFIRPRDLDSELGPED